jgi:hypothetical protein
MKFRVVSPWVRIVGILIILTLPILACGFGESRLAIETGDNVDEPRNRRAQYVLAAAEPVPGRWTVVSSAKP